MSEPKDSKSGEPRSKAGNRSGEKSSGGRGPREARLRGIARRLFGEEGEGGERDRIEARELLGSLWETGDKARVEVVRLIAREVRLYLEALEVGKDVHDLVTNYSLDINASIRLKPLGEALARAERREDKLPRSGGARRGSDPEVESEEE